MAIRTRISPNLWFDFNAKEAVDFYVSIFPDSKVLRTSHYLKDSPGPEGEIMTIEFQLDGLVFTAINGGPQFKFNESVSFLVECKDQAEVDSYWTALLAGGGEPGVCGWLKDRFGLSWQVNWTPLIDMLLDTDQEKAGRAMQAMLKMSKLDAAVLQKAYDGK
ncbi:VOC family protein [Mesorhizobium sp. ZC-5]|uniref:VOC family protein n=1 Tax=Mesorhizobium sp. ZC-5 TaxID=2986066 RepID=UPI0021E8D4F7|nr:VOC family protein [Mesorhizobium sp. ZC-5]MCV3243210.1 VOC family protein [Mesorhizobium sp. ZC-5]